VDFSASELRQSGSRVRIQEQPLRLLEILLEQPGEPVTRERLREALWASDTFVDFERSLNAAVAKLRQALHDSADRPVYVETVARKGYRFIAPVTPMAALPEQTVSGADAGCFDPAANCISRGCGGRVRRRAVRTEHGDLTGRAEAGTGCVNSGYGSICCGVSPLTGTIQVSGDGGVRFRSA
jgi:DNA-binding winged helix-turn-helix (wHTH) protein